MKSIERNESNSNTILDCSVCTLPIRDQLVFKVNGNHFHAACFNCSMCHNKLLDKCFAHDGNVYCQADFFQKFGTRCASCGRNISSSELVQRADRFVYHLQCFTCLICHQQLYTGDDFYLIDDQKLVCKIDYETIKARDFEDSTKRPRTTITQAQLDVLKQVYNTSQKPPRHVRESLASKTGLQMRVVQVWFQNRRAKEKRLKTDTHHRRPNAMRMTKINRRDLTRIGQQSILQEDDSSNEDDVIVSSEELSMHGSNDSSLHDRRINSNIPSSTNELLPFDSFYQKTNKLSDKTSELVSTRLLSSSSSVITIADDHGSLSEVDFNIFNSVHESSQPY